MGDFSSDLSFISTFLSGKSSSKKVFSTQERSSDMQNNTPGPGAPLKVQGLLARMSPMCRGNLRRRTRYTRMWRPESDVFEIRSTMLILYKRRMHHQTPSIGLLDAIFSRATVADLDRNSTSLSVGNLSSATDDSRGGNWNCVFELTGSKVTAVKTDEKSKFFPFKITFSSEMNSGENESINLCAESEQMRIKWIKGIEMASKGVRRENFELIKTVGRGQWGKVFLAKKNSGIVAARKQIKIPLSEANSVELLALKEVALSSKTNISHVQNERLIMEAVPPHEFLVNMQYAFRSGRFLYYALDFMNGGDLFRHWRLYRDQRNQMTPFYAAEVLLALEHLHKHNVVYRDLKPENVLLDSSGHIKVADLGLAKMLTEKGGRTTSFCGTEAYLAPEMVLRIPYSYSVDFWQFGCFLFELYAGRSPFWLPRKPRKVIRDNILSGNFAFPSSVPDKAKPLINALLNINENNRLGSSLESNSWDSVKYHSFFKEMDWVSLLEKKLVPPIIPDDPGPSLCNNFDEDFTCQFPKWGEHPDGPGNDSVNAYEEELLGFNFVRFDQEQDIESAY